jgi:hypothetical protein
MENKFPKILQIGMIVRDIEEAVKHWEEDYGIGPWDIIEFGPKMFPKMLVDGKPGMIENKNAFCKAYSFEIELIQPISESPYMDFLREHGPGLHHIAAITKPDFNEMIADEAKKGRKPWVWCKEDNGKVREGMEFAYLDLREELGTIVEIYNEDRE